MTETVTITLDEDIIKKLDGLKTDKTPGYTEIIHQIINNFLNDDYLTSEELNLFNSALKEVEAGNYYTLEQISEILDQEP